MLRPLDPSTWLELLRQQFRRRRDKRHIESILAGSDFLIACVAEHRRDQVESLEYYPTEACGHIGERAFTYLLGVHSCLIDAACYRQRLMIIVREVDMLNRKQWLDDKGLIMFFDINKTNGFKKAGECIFSGEKLPHKIWLLPDGEHFYGLLQQPYTELFLYKFHGKSIRVMTKIANWVSNSALKEGASPLMQQPMLLSSGELLYFCQDEYKPMLYDAWAPIPRARSLDEKSMGCSDFNRVRVLANLPELEESLQQRAALQQFFFVRLAADPTYFGIFGRMPVSMLSLIFSYYPTRGRDHDMHAPFLFFPAVRSIGLPSHFVMRIDELIAEMEQHIKEFASSPQVANLLRVVQYCQQLLHERVADMRYQDLVVEVERYCLEQTGFNIVPQYKKEHWWHSVWKESEFKLNQPASDYSRKYLEELMSLLQDIMVLETGSLGLSCVGALRKR